MYSNPHTIKLVLEFGGKHKSVEAIKDAQQQQKCYPILNIKVTHQHINAVFFAGNGLGLLVKADDFIVKAF